MLIPFLTLSSAVTFAAPTDTLARLLPKLGAAMGQRLTADRTAGQQVLLVRVRNMDRTRLLDLVADVIGGVWEEAEGGGRRLTLGPRRLRELRETDAKGRETWIAEARKEVKGALGGALSMVDDAALARLAPGERIVWSSQPNSLQRRLPSGDLWGEALITELQRSPDELFAHLEDIPSRSVSPTLFCAKRGLDSSNVGIWLGAFGPDGHQARKRMFRLETPLRTLPLSPSLKHKPVAFPEEVRRWHASLQEDAEPALAQASMARRLHPERFEPLGFTCGPWLGACADALGTDLVANLPDTANLWGPGATSELENWLNDGFARGGMEFRIDRGTLVGRPVERAFAAERRADRSEIRRRLAAVEIHGDVPLAFPPMGNFATAYVKSFLGWPMIEENPEGERRAMQAWLNLSPDRRGAALQSGVSVPAGFAFGGRFGNDWSGPNSISKPPQEARS